TPGWVGTAPSSGRRSWRAWGASCSTSGCSGGSPTSRETDMGPAAARLAGPGIRDLPPNIFAIAMATGIVSLGANGAGFHLLAHGLFWLNVALYAVLSLLLVLRALRHRAALAADLKSHARAPGFFTLVAAPCVLGNQCVLLLGTDAAGLALLLVGGL